MQVSKTVRKVEDLTSLRFQTSSRVGERFCSKSWCC